MCTARPFTFQDMIISLQNFWAHGSFAQHGYEVGAGTFHPETTLRALGPNTIAALATFAAPRRWVRR